MFKNKGFVDRFVVIDGVKNVVWDIIYFSDFVWCINELLVENKV